MAPMDIIACTAEQVLCVAEIDTASTDQAYHAKYMWNGVLVQLYFQNASGADDLLAHLDSLGLDPRDVDYGPIDRVDETIDIMARDDIDPRYKVIDSPDYFVVIERHGARHFFPYTVAENAGISLEEFLDELGLSSGHPSVTVCAINLVDWED